MDKESKVNISRFPNSIDFNRLLKEVQKGNENALEDIYDYLDEIVSENIKLKQDLKNIFNILNEKYLK